MRSDLSDTLPLARPDIGERERAYVAAVLESGRLAGGPWLERFEALLRDVCGVPYALGVSSGTSALHLIVDALGLGSGDEVITTPFSFVASANCLLYAGALPRFVDIEPDSLNIDPSRLDEACSPRTRAVLAVDVFGRPAAWPDLERFCADRGLLLIADACEALGAASGGRPIGSWGNAAAFGFYPNKQITTGEGGAVTTRSESVYAFCRSARNQGRARDDRMEHVRLGYNYRLNELSAALGCAQLERLPELLSARRERAAWYAEALADLDDALVLPSEGADARSWFVYVVRLRDDCPAGARDTLISALRVSHIASSPYFPSIHLQPYYRERFGYKPGAFPICESVSERSMALPFFAGMERGDVDRVADALRGALHTLSLAQG